MNVKIEDNKFDFSSIIKNNNLKEIHNGKQPNYGDLIYKALSERTTVYDSKNDRIFLFTENSIIDVDNILKDDISNILERYYLNFVSKEGLINLSSRIYGGLLIMEYIHSAYIDTPKLSELKKDFFNYMINEKNKSYEKKNMIELAIGAFIDKSEETVNKREVKFPNLHYTLVIGEEKAFKRNEFIAELLKYGIIDYNFLAENGVISKLTLIEMEEIYRKQGLLSNNELQHALIISNNFESRKDILNYYIKKDKRFYLEFAKTEEIARAVIDEKIDSQIAAKKLQNSDIKDLDIDLLEELLSYKNLSKKMSFINISRDDKRQRYIDKNLFKELDRQRFMRIVLSDKVAYKNPLNSNNYIDFYGKINSDDIILLNQKGLVNSEDIIKLIKFSSIKAQDDEEYNKMIENIMNFYDADKLEELLLDDKINKNFSQLFNKFLNENLTEEQAKHYVEKLLNDMSSKENGDELLIKLMSKEIVLPNVCNYSIGTDKIQNMYFEEIIDEEDIILFYKYNYIDIDTLREFLRDGEIIEKFQNGEIGYEALKYVADRENVIKNELDQERLGIKEVIDLYVAEDGLDIDELKAVTENYDLTDVEVAELLPDNVSPDSVEELFMNYYISHDDLSNLVERGIITKSQATKYAENMANHEEYENIFNKGVVILAREGTDYKNSRRHGPRKYSERKKDKFKNDPQLQEELIDELGFDNRVLVLKGERNSLSGYKIYPSEELGVMVFLNNRKPNNAIYITSLQQGLYFLNKAIREDKYVRQEDNTISSNVTKRTLRNTEHVKVKNASKGLGKNIVDAIKSLSPVLKERLKNDDTYRQNIEDIIEEMREDYILRKD